MAIIRRDLVADTDELDSIQIQSGGTTLTIGSIVDGEVLTRSGTSIISQGLVSTLDDLTDVYATTPVDGEVLTYSASSPTGWISQALPDDIDHDAVTLTSIPSPDLDYITLGGVGGQEISVDYVDLTTDVIGTLPFSDLPNVTSSTILGRGDSGNGIIEEISIGTGLTLTGTTLSADAQTINSLDDISDVDATSPTNGQVLVWDTDGSPNAWRAETIDHDTLQGYVANEHIDWTVDQSPTIIDANNIPAVDTSATSTSVTQIGHTLQVGDIVYLDAVSSPPIYDKAQANSGDTSDVIGIVSSVNGDDFTIVTHGRVSGLSGLDANATLFLSDTTAGALTSTQPTSSGHISKPIFFSDSATSGYFINLRGIEIDSEPNASLIKSAYESNADTNAFTDAEKTKLSNLNIINVLDDIGDVDTTGVADGYTLQYSASSPTGWVAADPGHIVEVNDLSVAVTWGSIFVPDANISSTSVTQYSTDLEGVINHDNLQGFVADEHIDWTEDQTIGSPDKIIHPNNLPTSLHHDAVTLVSTPSPDLDYITLSPGGQELDLGYINLGTDVEGLLPTSDIDNLDGAIDINSNVSANTAARHTAATLETSSSPLDYLTLDEGTQVFTLNQLDLSTDVTGTLPFSNLPTVTASKLLGRGDSGSGDIEEITIGSGLTLTGTTLSADAQTINSLDDISDVDAPTPTNGQVLVWDTDGSPNAWRAETLNIPSSESTSQEITQTNSFAVGTPVYYNGSSWVASDAAAESSAEVAGIVSASTGSAFTLTTSGLITGITGTPLVAGDVYFLGVGGGRTTIEPSTVDQVSKPILYAISTTEAIVLQMRGSTITNGLVRVDFGVTGGGETEVLPTVSQSKVATMHVSRDMTLEEVLVGVTTPCSGSYAEFDVQLNDSSSPAGTSIFSTLPRIDNGDSFSADSVTQSVLAIQSLTKGDELSFWCEQADASGNATGLKFYLSGNVDTNARLLDYSISATDESTDLSASTTVPVATFHAPRDFTIEDIYIGVTSAPSGGAGIVADVHLYNNDSPTGLTIFSSQKPKIDAGTTFSGDSATPAVLDPTQITINKGDKLELYCDSVDATPGAGLKFYINAKY